MTLSAKLSKLLVILVYIISVSSLNIHKSKRIIQQPLRVLAPPDTSGNKYLSLTATFDIEDDEVPIISAEQAYYNVKEEEPVSENSEQIYSINDEEEVRNKSAEQTYTSDYDEQEPTENSELAYNIEKEEPVTKKSHETYNIDDDEQAVSEKSFELKQNVEEDEEVIKKRLEETYHKTEEHGQVDRKNSEHRYNTERYTETPKKTFKQRYQQDKEVRNKSSVQTESRRRSFNNDYGSTKTPKTFSKRTEEATTIVPIIENENYVFAYNGDYHYSYKGADGTQAFERGERKAAKEGGAEDVVVGGYSYKDKDGNDFSLTYTAGENGYRPVGAHLPTPPPIPPAIQRVLRILATKTTPEPVTESLSNYDYN